MTTDKIPAPRKIEYRWFVAGCEVDPGTFWAELRRLGGRAGVETVDPPEPGRYVPTPAGQAALAQRREAAGDA